MNINESEYTKRFCNLAPQIWSFLFVLIQLLSKSALNRITLNDRNDQENKKYDNVSRKFMSVGTAFNLLNLIKNWSDDCVGSVKLERRV